MAELSAWELINSGAVLAILAYVISNERRVTALETIIKMMNNTGVPKNGGHTV